MLWAWGATHVKDLIHGGSWGVSLGCWTMTVGNVAMAKSHPFCGSGTTTVWELLTGVCMSSVVGHFGEVCV
jgi:hypothetical protein